MTLFAFDKAPTVKKRDIFAFDRSSTLSYDGNGKLHVKMANITKAAVNGYYGHEIPKHAELGLLPNKLYQLYRHPDELALAVDSANNIQLLDRHIAVHADDHKPDETVGSTGTDAVFDGKYLKNSLVVWAQGAIDGIETKQQRELSSSYAYDADMTPGIVNGLHYDGVMRRIRFNHVALVEKGRAGSDVAVGDSRMVKPLTSRQAIMVQGALSAALSPKLTAGSVIAYDAALQDVTAKNLKTKTKGIAKAVLAAAKGKFAEDAEITAEDISAVIEAVQIVAMDEDDMAAEDAKDDDEDEDEAKKKAAAKKDDKPEPKEDKKPAMDAVAMDAAIQAAKSETRKEVFAELSAIRQAEKDVRPRVGEVTIACDSAAAVYKVGLEAAGVKDLDGIPEVAYGAMYRALPAMDKEVKNPVRFAADAAHTATVTEMFPNNSRLG